MRSKTIKGFRRITARWNAVSDMDAIVAAHRGRILNKWKHYFEVYDRHFAHLRDQPITLLEIGVQAGGSLELWRAYFGPKAHIIGVDVDPKCAAFESENTFVRIGSQGEPSFLEDVASEFGPFDVVIEDGSHAYDHQILTFRTLFPHVKPSGLYCCEDLCTSYWDKDFGGGWRKPGTGIEFFKALVDEQNAWFARDDVDSDPTALAHSLFGLHFYPALAIVEKRLMSAPLQTPVGTRERAA
jgi:cephalosporin hydroxylase